MANCRELKYKENEPYNVSIGLILRKKITQKLNPDIADRIFVRNPGAVD